MGWIADLLKEIPLSAILKEKIATIEADYAAVKTENAILKDDLRQARRETAKIKRRLGELSRKEEIGETESRILTLMTKQLVSHNELTDDLKISDERLQFYLRRLLDGEYIKVAFETTSGKRRFALDQRGREHLIAIRVI